MNGDKVLIFIHLQNDYAMAMQLAVIQTYSCIPTLSVFMSGPNLHVSKITENKACWCRFEF